MIAFRCSFHIMHHGVGLKMFSKLKLPHLFRWSCCLGCGFFSLVIFGAVITLAIFFPLRYAVPDKNSSNNYCVPNETLAISYSSTFCDSISIDVDLTDGTSAAFYILSHAPALNLSSPDSFSFHEQRNFPIQNFYYSWNFYLYPGSTLTVSVCKQSRFSHFSYSLIKGGSSFSSWKHNHQSSLAKQYYTIGTLCSLAQRSRFQYMRCY